MRKVIVIVGNMNFKRYFWVIGNVPKKQRRGNHALSSLKNRGFKLARRAWPASVPKMLLRMATH